VNSYAIPARLDRVRSWLSEQSIDAVLVSQPENRVYLSGFRGSAGVLFISADLGLIATDFRYYDQVGIESPLFELVKVTSTFVDVLPEMLARRQLKRVAFEADHATFVDAQEWMQAAPELEWVPTKGVIMEMRAVKDADEIETLREAIRLTDEALGSVLAQVTQGMTERQLAWSIESYIRTHDAPAVSFEIIAAAGPSGARPHAKASDTALPVGEPIVIDMGARIGGYNADLTRTVCIGQPHDPERFWKVYDTVLLAQQAAEAAIRPGMTGKEVDAIARDLISEAGYGEYFGHGLGHGVGLAIHELPRLSRLATAPLLSGNVVTVEPGIYLPDWGGVRIEDVVLVTEDGVEVLTKAPKDPVISCVA
jgi:Xaa-Pro aminopeptidase